MQWQISWKNTRLIGFRCKPGNGLSREVLINQIIFLFIRLADYSYLKLDYRIFEFNDFWRLWRPGNTQSHPRLPKPYRTYSLGDSCGADTPDPIPNSAVKRFSADDIPALCAFLCRNAKLKFKIKSVKLMCRFATFVIIINRERSEH